MTVLQVLNVLINYNIPPAQFQRCALKLFWWVEKYYLLYLLYYLHNAGQPLTM